MISYNKDNGNTKMISAKEISDKYHITYQAVNHYTDLGLLQVLSRKGNVRFYNRGVVYRRLKQITDLRKEGYSLRLIRKRLIGI